MLLAGHFADTMIYLLRNDINAATRVFLDIDVRMGDPRYADSAKEALENKEKFAEYVAFWVRMTEKEIGILKCLRDKYVYPSVLSERSIKYSVIIEDILGKLFNDGR